MTYKMQPFWWFLPLHPIYPLNPSAWAYFDLTGEIWLQFYGYYLDAPHGEGSLGAEGCEGYYFDR